MSIESINENHDEADNEEKKRIDRETFNYAWEDSFIVFLRDLQWIKNPNPKSLPPLFKLDGEAENALSDVIFGAKDRYFIIELKSGSTRMGDEASKPIASLLGELESLVMNGGVKNWGDGGKASLMDFLGLSRRGHFMLMPFTRKRKQVSEGDVKGFRVEVEMHPYLEVAANLIRNKTYSPEEPKIPLEKFLYPEPDETSTGLESHEMIAYIDFLMKAHQAYRGEELPHPLKCVIWGNNRLFWPCIDLANIEDLHKIFQPALERQDRVLATLHLKQTRHLVDRLKIAQEHLSATMATSGTNERLAKLANIANSFSWNSASSDTSPGKDLSAFKAVGVKALGLSPTQDNTLDNIVKKSSSPGVG